MKKWMALALFAGMLLISARAFAFGLPNVASALTGGGGGTADVNGLISNAANLKTKMTNASICLAEALVLAEKAVGNAALAEKLEAAIADVKASKDDLEKTKVLNAVCNTATDELASIDLEAKMDKTQARENLGKSLLQLGAGTLLDLQAANAAKGMVGSIQGAISGVKSNPLAYGPSTITGLTSALSTATYAVEALPSQATKMASLSKRFADYATTNSIPQPSQKDGEKMAENLTPR